MIGGGVWRSGSVTPPDALLDPETLTSGERKSLKEAFQLIASLHDTLSRRYGVQAGKR